MTQKTLIGCASIVLFQWSGISPVMGVEPPTERANTAITASSNEAPKVPSELSEVFNQRMALATDRRLEVTVSLEARRARASTVVDEIGKQAHVPLTLSPRLQSRFLTARFNAQPLREVMWALCRLYGLTWHPNGDGYVGDLDGNSLESTLGTVGDVDTLRNSSYGIGAGEHRRLGERAVVDYPQLMNGKPILFGSLPENLSSALRTSTEERNAIELVALYARALPMNILNSRLEWRELQPTKNTLGARSGGKNTVSTVIFTLRYNELTTLPLGWWPARNP